MKNFFLTVFIPSCGCISASNEIDEKVGQVDDYECCSSIIETSEGVEYEVACSEDGLEQACDDATEKLKAKLNCPE